jgi:hypothetical protein
LAFQTPAPKDTENLLSKVDQQEKEENARLVEYLKGVAKLIEGLKAEVTFLISYNFLNFILLIYLNTMLSQ